MATVSDRLFKVLGSTETTETKIGDVTFPVGAKRIVGIYAYAMSTASGTTDESVTGYVRITGKNLQHDHYLPLAISIIGVPEAMSQMAGFIPLDIPVGKNETVDFYIALDMLTTINHNGIVFIVYEV